MTPAPSAMTRIARRRRAMAPVLALLSCIWPALAQTPDTPPWQPTTPALEGAQLALLDAALARLPPQRPGVTDLYVLGVAGDADEDVFRNEVAYLRQLSAQRWGAAGRMLALANQPDPLASEGALPTAASTCIPARARRTTWRRRTWRSCWTRRRSATR